MNSTSTLKQLIAHPISSELFQPFGQVIFPSADGAAYGPQDAQLQLSNGTPRFYIMRLDAKGRQFHTITRHQQCTQCLGSLGGQDWLMAVAPPSEGKPNPDEIVAFQIPGNCFINLKMGTWHAGPYFEQAAIDFYNLELSDTNITDHETCNLKASYGLEFEILGSQS
ncbi:Ureidoglycolate lyase [Acaryochloris thomasi RCC1774]|uniref:Ureidoglycolate lyase n=1 Tax=Acaryochloris thomasi RCC1774 TaxID=1764569 RepID=A0A2W1JZV0_9CYAN|nr:ureidoglycolate lyase [Acaryochloris thomasi]PZD73607.1 Ureidoglycolate lyase [Acaryochloris thomasi RCC1774]